MSENQDNQKKVKPFEKRYKNVTRESDEYKIRLKDEYAAYGGFTANILSKYIVSPNNPYSPVFYDSIIEDFEAQLNNHNSNSALNVNTDSIIKTYKERIARYRKIWDLAFNREIAKLKTVVLDGQSDTYNSGFNSFGTSQNDVLISGTIYTSDNGILFPVIHPHSTDQSIKITKMIINLGMDPYVHIF